MTQEILLAKGFEEKRDRNKIFYQQEWLVIELQGLRYLFLYLCGPNVCEREIKTEEDLDLLIKFMRGH